MKPLFTVRVVLSHIVNLFIFNINTLGLTRTKLGLLGLLGLSDRTFVTRFQKKIATHSPLTPL